jgi:hypothetical protein
MPYSPIIRTRGKDGESTGQPADVVVGSPPRLLWDTAVDLKFFGDITAKIAVEV